MCDSENICACAKVRHRINVSGLISAFCMFRCAKG